MNRWRAVGGVLYSTIIAFAFMGSLFALYLKEIPASQRDFALVLLGALIVEVSRIGAFYMGSTVGSQAKDATIAHMANNRGP